MRSIGHLLHAWVLLVLVAGSAAAGGYFRVVDPSGPRGSVGTFVDPTGQDSPDAGGMLAVLYHRAGEGGQLIPNMQADWTALGVGAGRGAGGAFVAVGPSVNLSPAVRGLAVRALDLVSPDGFGNLRALFAAAPDSGPDVQIAFGPAWLCRMVDGGRWQDPKDWRGHFRLFAGAAWQFK